MPNQGYVSRWNEPLQLKTDMQMDSQTDKQTVYKYINICIYTYTYVCQGLRPHPGAYAPSPPLLWCWGMGLYECMYGCMHASKDGMRACVHACHVGQACTHTDLYACHGSMHARMQAGRRHSCRHAAQASSSGDQGSIALGKGLKPLALTHIYIHI